MEEQDGIKWEEGSEKAMHLELIENITQNTNDLESIVSAGNTSIEAEEKMYEVEVSHIEDSTIFRVNRSQIKEEQLSDQNAELQSLGLSVYNQETLERGIIEQVDQALEQLDRQHLEQKINNVADEILLCKQQLKKAEMLLKALNITGSTNQKQIITLKKEIDTKHKKLAELNSQAEVLQQQYSSFRGEEGIDVLHPAVTSLKINQQQESERERKIRLGQMTPFGNVLGNKLTSTNSNPEKSLTEFEKYLQNQAELQKKQRTTVKKKLSKKNVEYENKVFEDDGGNRKEKETKKHSPFKKSILMPKKRHKKEKLGTDSSYDWCDKKKKPGKLMSETTALDDSEGSEYLPSESELEELEKKERSEAMQVSIKKKKISVKRKQQKLYKDPEEWGTDDSDWDYSDETRVKRRKSTKKEIDDGNIEDFYERLNLWEMEKAKHTDSTSVGDHEMEGGYKLPKTLWSKLYNYQKVAVQWLWELNQQRCGGILGDEMGLGKTVQVIAFLAGLSYSKLHSRHGNFRGLGPSLIVCPTTVMHQWVREFHVWWPQFRVAVLHESGSFNGKRASLISQMNSVGCVLVTSYVGVVQHQEALLSKNWHYVILDEGHKIRNPDAQVTLAVKQFRTPYRLILSGSPMQNNLKELWSLFDFIFPGKLGTLPVFLAQMAVPITQGGYANASEVQVATAYRCATVLRDTIAPYLLRRMKTDVKSHIQLPAKSEQVLFCRLTEEQRTLYKGYLDSGEVERILQGRFQVFVGLIALRKICNHPDLYSGGPKLLRGDNEEDLPEESRYGYWRRAGKMLVIESLLSIWHKQGHRVLLFTQSRQMLCILEAFIQKHNYKYLKLDGGTGVASRQPLINKYNEDASYFIFLLTTRVGGLGVNLTGADRVVIYDPDWNPATDTQARERAWRIGQQNNVTVYRLVTAGTIEEKIYHRQIFKQFLCNKVLRDPRQRRFFKSNDLLELFTLAESEQTTETAAIFAGTGSEVKVTPRKAKSEKQRKLKIKDKNETSNVKFSSEKLERMKRLAQILSKQIAVSSTQEPPKSKDKHYNSENCNGLSCRTSNDDFDNKLYVEQRTTEVKEKIVENYSSVKEEPIEQSSSMEQKQSCTNVKKYSSVNEEPVEQNSSMEQKQFCANVSDNCSIKQCESVMDHKQNQNIPVVKNGHQEGKSKNRSASNIESCKQYKKHRKHKKHSRRKKEDALFEGERVPYLVGQSQTNETHQNDDNSLKEDDYVLRKLFKKSGIQTAMRHDTIMEGGDADYALVEGEAKRVAKEAVKAMKESRRECWQADRGVPSWTGQSGILRSRNVSTSQARLRFGKKNTAASSSTSVVKNNSKEAGPSQDSKNEQPMSSSELLSRMRARNRLLEPVMEEPEQENTGEDAQEETVTPSSGSVQEDHMELLTDIRNFVAFGASVDGRATTQEILSQFSNRLPPGSSPLFKFMLSEVCEFHRMPSGEGVWKLCSNLRW
ncbi:DNA excision repair protein ERCC-6-like [Periplaneta americana]|uniref:DNA excision repair protein ERCC-6-like n=1 Tax=Periplaneta americana TaxID=6978 RepID=UPI0037E91510